MKYLFLFLFFNVEYDCHANSLPVHDFHVSKLDINHNKKTASLELTIHVFLDDLLKAVKLSTNNKEGNLSSESIEFDALLQEYISKKIKLEIDGKSSLFLYIGKEKSDSDAAVYLYFTISNVKEMKQIKIIHTLFHEVFDDQKNIVSITYRDKLKGFTMLDAKTTFYKLDL
ncbi:MAG: DUF6702 family protein [Saprospiraceae bacterium]